jgi:hypothetical protein
MTKRGDERRRLPMAVRRLGVKPLAAPAASMCGRHGGLRPGLIDEHEALGIELLLALPEALPLGRYVRPVLLGGGDDFFKGDLLLGEKAPDRAIADMDMARGKLAPYVVKRQIGRRGDAGEQPVSLVFET